MPKVVGIPGCQRQSMTACGCRDETINRWQLAAGSFRLGLKCGPLTHFLLTERKYAPGKGWKKFGHQPALQFPSLSSLGEQQNPLSDFRNRNHADIESEARLGGEPGRHIRIRPCPGRLTQDIRVEKKIQNVTVRGRSLSRTIESSLKSAGQVRKTSQIPRSGARLACQSLALTITTNGLPCFVTS